MMAEKGKAFKNVEYLTETGNQGGCGPDCPMYGSPLRHRHFLITVQTLNEEITPQFTEDDIQIAVDPTFMKSLELCGDGEGSDRVYDFRRPALPKPSRFNGRKTKGKNAGSESSDEDGADEEAEAGEEGEESDSAGKRYLTRKWRKLIATANYPILLFSSSPRIGLTPPQRMLMRTIPLELTRPATGKKSKRADGAEVITAGGSGTGGEQGTVTVAPDLLPGRYVAFNGNGAGNKSHLRGRGYSLKAWMRRTGYLPKTDINDAIQEEGSSDTSVPLAGTQMGDKSAEFWDSVKWFKNDLKTLAESFSLSVWLWNQSRREWQSFDAVTESVRSKSGRTWLRKARVRIYAPEDYLQRWRNQFAAWMGFRVIPAPGDETVSLGGRASSPARVRQFLRDNGLRQIDLARVLQVSANTLSALMNDRQKWSEEWADRIDQCLDQLISGSTASSS